MFADRPQDQYRELRERAALERCLLPHGERTLNATLQGFFCPVSTISRRPDMIPDGRICAAVHFDGNRLFLRCSSSEISRRHPQSEKTADLGRLRTIRW